MGVVEVVGGSDGWGGQMLCLSSVGCGMISLIFDARRVAQSHLKVAMA